MTDQDTASIAGELLNDQAFAKELANRLDVNAIGQRVATDEAFAKEMARQFDIGAFGERVATDPAFAAAFTANLTRELDTRALAREDRRYNRARFAMSAIGLLGLVGIGGAVSVFMDSAARQVITEERPDIVLAVKEKVEEEFGGRLATEVDGLRSEIVALRERVVENRDELHTELVNGLDEAKIERRLAFDLLALERLATQLDQASGYSAAERDSVLAALRKFKGVPKLREDPQLAAVIETASRVFYAANQKQALEEIDDLYSEIAAGDQAISDIFVTYYGEQLLSTIGAPAAWDPTYLDRLEFYGKAVRMLSYPEDVMPYEILVAYIKAGKRRTNETAEMLRRVRDLTPQEQASSYFALFKYTDASFWQIKETEWGRSIAAVAQAFDEQHRDVLDELWRDEEVAQSLAELAFQNLDVAPLFAGAIVERLRVLIE